MKRLLTLLLLGGLTLLISNVSFAGDVSPGKESKIKTELKTAPTSPLSIITDAYQKDNLSFAAEGNHYVNLFTPVFKTYNTPAFNADQRRQVYEKRYKNYRSLHWMYNTGYGKAARRPGNADDARLPDKTPDKVSQHLI